MTITVVCDVLGEENNGTTIAAMNLIRFLKAQGHTVRILCGDADKKGEEGYYVVPNYNFGKLLNAYVKKVGVTLAKPVKKIIEEALEGVDLVHIMVPLALGMATCKIARGKGLPITAGFHMQAENLTCYFKINKINAFNVIFCNNKIIWCTKSYTKKCIDMLTPFIILHNLSAMCLKVISKEQPMAM